MATIECAPQSKEKCLEIVEQTVKCVEHPGTVFNIYNWSFYIRKTFSRQLSQTAYLSVISPAALVSVRRRSPLPAASPRRT